ncbi:MAG: 16S rRNA (cytosine(1402)-N(4))-methyltransferase RsmH [Paracoccaceae bacterium]|jgi:16S rRNA (cytosine1402-N4)-methyltransferase
MTVPPVDPENTETPHVPVLLDPIMDRISPLSGVWLDGTFGAGGYARAILDAGAERLIGVDRDPEALERAAVWAGEYGERLQIVSGCFGDLDKIAGAGTLDGVVLDIGVSSMQIDQAERGFSFMKDGPLDMRMGQSGPSAADIVNKAPEKLLADILFQFGEERASRKIAKAIVMDRKIKPFKTTRQLAGMLERIMPRPKPGQPHAATRSFQALRIVVNDELGELARGLAAAEVALKEGGLLVVVTFHSLEDRMVKRFMQERSGAGPKGSRFTPIDEVIEPAFTRITRKAVVGEEAEISANPRARSAKLRISRRTSSAADTLNPKDIGMPTLDITKGAWM